jgi:hypothetical protein
VTVVDPPEDGDAFSEFIAHNGGGDRIKVVGKPGNFATHEPSKCSVHSAPRPSPILMSVPE